jgi:hypothetical protein
LAHLTGPIQVSSPNMLGLAATSSHQLPPSTASGHQLQPPFSDFSKGLKKEKSISFSQT